ncbi:MAG: EF-hand domain-containing protein [Myxococcota bacterium]
MTTDPASTSTLTQDQRDALKVQFDLLDSDGDTKISLQELTEVLKRDAYAHLGEDGRQRVLDSFAAVDSDGDGKVDFDGFLALMHGPQAEQDARADFRRAFDEVDLDKDGYLTVADFQRISKAEGAPLTEEQAKEMIEMADKNEDGKVSFEEYYEIMTQG